MASARTWLLLGAACGGLGVMLGAFGAHWLESAVVRWGLEQAEQQRRLEQWETAVRYQMYHALAIVAVAGFSATRPSRLLPWSGVAFLFGTLVFSGCLYLLVLTGARWLGMIVPIGGTAMIIGWLLLALAAWQRPE